MKFSLNLILLVGFAVSPLAVTAQNPVLINTFTNPVPAVGGRFGSAMVALGGDRVLIGARNNATTATNAGAVYLFHTNGTLLATFTNPIPASVSDTYYYFGEWFGGAIATLGNDRVLIGSPRDQKVYLFATNGALVSTISRPNSDDLRFGFAIAAIGNDRVLIGAPDANFDPYTYVSYGAAYLYNTNGALLATFNNFYPEEGCGLGFSAAAFGSDRVLIGSGGYGPWAAQLFNTNGTRMMTFTNSGPQDYSLLFGSAVTPVGADRVLVGVPAYGTNSGVVSLFKTNGDLLLTINNPTPAAEDRFGFRMAMLENERVVIGAPLDDTTGTNAGAAYVFSVNGTLLATINNPTTPATGDWFGYRLAAFGNEGVIISAPFDGTEAPDSGSVYLFSVPSQPTAPSLSIRSTSSNTVAVSWPSPSTGFLVQQNTNGIGSVNWSNVTEAIEDDGSNKTLFVNPTGQSRFYRLVQP
jgi:hypothetical protein